MQTQTSLVGMRFTTNAIEAPIASVTVNDENELLAMHRDAYYGIAGDLVRLVEPESEADPAAVLVTFLVGAGNFLGRRAYFSAGGAKHFANEFAVIIGDSSKARKGTSANPTKALLTLADEDYMARHYTSGLSSGEGLIHALCLANDKRSVRTEANASTAVTSDGSSLLIVEGEFARTLKVMNRETNTLSAVLREAWDGSPLNNKTKNNPASCSNAHVSMVGHITIEELKRLLTQTDSMNGFANRFIWIYSRRSKIVPLAREISKQRLMDLAALLRHARERLNSTTEIHFDEEARDLWISEYERLSEGRPGLVGAMTSREEAHAVRFATIYAL